MAKFNVTVYEARSTDVVIDAETHEEAWETADWKYNNDELFYGQFNDATTVDIYVARSPHKETPNE